MRLKMYWTLDDELYEANITSRKDNSTVFIPCYTDGTEQLTIISSVPSV